jgi:hypothetical protein
MVWQSPSFNSEDEPVTLFRLNCFGLAKRPLCRPHLLETRTRLGEIDPGKARTRVGV